MTCPDENVFIQIQEGRLGASATADFHRHLDACPACLELAGILGCLHDVDLEHPENVAPKITNGRPDTEVRNSPSIGRILSNKTRGVHSMLTIAQAVMLLLHVYSSVALVPILWSGADVTVRRGALGVWPVHSLWLPYILIWGFVGPLAALVALIGMLARRRWQRAAARFYALLCLPTVFLAPLSLCLLFAARRRRMPQ